MNATQAMIAIASALREEDPELRGCHGGWVHPAACYASYALGGDAGKRLAGSLTSCEDGHTIDHILEDIEHILERRMPMTREAMSAFFEIRTPREAARTAENLAALLARDPECVLQQGDVEEAIQHAGGYHLRA